MSVTDKQIEAPIFGSRKYWSAVSAFVVTVSTYMITKSEGLAYFTGFPFVGNVAAVFIQNMITLKQNGAIEQHNQVSKG